MKTVYAATSAVKSARRARAQGGISVPRQLVEIFFLRHTKYKLRSEEYFDYRLYDPQMSWNEKRRFLGSWAKDRIYRIQDRKVVQLLSDKLSSYQIFRSNNIPSPALKAATHPAVDVDGVVPLRSPDDVSKWLQTANMPLFLKPATSYRGFGNKLVTSVNAEADQIAFGDGSIRSLAEFATELGAPNSQTMLFQELIVPHPAIDALTGGRVATVRLLVLNDGAEPEIKHGGLRLPVGNSMVDNFRGGKSGNLLARIDLKTGRLVDVLSGIGLDWKTIDRHPDSGSLFAGFTIPDWKPALELVLRASNQLRGLKIHHWDVAFTIEGPTLIETNPRGDLGIPQITTGRGLADDRFLKLYEGGKL